MASAVSPAGIDSMMKEARLFQPPEAFAANAHVGSMAEYERLYREAETDPDNFWAGVAGELHWFKPWDKVLEWNAPWAKWFPGGQLNVSYNCVDRHVASSRANKAALIWEGEPGDIRTITYRQLLAEVSKMANVLLSLGVGKGDRVAIYMGMVPELAIAMLACARIGALHTVIFGGFSSNALVDRIRDCAARLVITQDAGWRKGSELKLKAVVDEALVSCPSVESVVVCRRTGSAVVMKPGRDVWWHEEDGGCLRRTHSGSPRLRSSAASALYVRHDGKAQGSAAHHRRLLGGNLHHRQVGLRPERGRRLLVHRRHRLDHGPQLYRVRAAAKRRHLPDV